MNCSSIESPPPWASLRCLREEAARTAALAEAILDHLEVSDEGRGFTAEQIARDEKAVEWSEGEERRAHDWLAHRERELFVP